MYYKLSLKYLISSLLFSFLISSCKESEIDLNTQNNLIGTTWFSGAEPQNKKLDSLINSSQLTIKPNQEVTDSISRTGDFSVILKKKGQYGFGSKLENFSAGDLIVTSVWYKGPAEGLTLIVAAKDQWSSSKKVIIEKEGWKKLTIQTILKINNDQIKFHVQSNSDSLVFVDDLSIYQFNKAPPKNLKNEGELNEFDLKIPVKSYNKIRKIRKKALKKGILVSEKKDWVKAEINGEKCHIRLKGDWTDHLAYYKWSYRIKFKNHPENAYSITNPISRGFAQEWISQQFMAKEKLMTTGFNLVFVKINGENFGVYGREDHFTDRILTKYKMNPKGYIFKFDESDLWDIRYSNNREDQPVSNVFMAANIDSYQDDRLKKNRNEMELFKKLGSQMDLLKYGNYDADSLFDIEYQAKFLAMIDLFSAYHGLIWHNVRMYIDPETKKIRQIGYDLNTPHISNIQENPLYNNSYSTMLYKPLFNSKEFKRKYIYYLTKFTKTEYINKVFSKIRPKLTKIESALLLEYNSDFIQHDFIFKRADFLRTGLAKLDTAKFFNQHHSIHKKSTLGFDFLPFKRISVKAYIQNSSNDINSILINSVYNKSIEVIGWIDPKTKELVKFKTALIIGSYKKKHTIPSSVDTKLNTEITTLIYRVPNKNENYKIKINKTPYPASWINSIR